MAKKKLKRRPQKRNLSLPSRIKPAYPKGTLLEVIEKAELKMHVIIKIMSHKSVRTEVIIKQTDQYGAEKLDTKAVEDSVHYKAAIVRDYKSSLDEDYVHLNNVFFQFEFCEDWIKANGKVITKSNIPFLDKLYKKRR